MIKVNLPLTVETRKELKAGDLVELNGDVYTARDQAHKRLVDLINKGEPLPFKLKDQTIFYAGPAPPKDDDVIGSIGPTTSARMDTYTPLILKQGLKGMIGKGNRTEEVARAMKRHRAVYFVATGGAAAYLSQFVVDVEMIAWKKLGPEAVYRLTLKDFPVVVAIDSKGTSIFHG